ncbi:MAG TPA: 30S ribosomal protein S6 [Chthoniobacterales bacterium]|nr:30S ribosomal protein S6 [Chthoniobacterales bacterium]
MNNKYDILLALVIKEEGIDELLARLEKIMNAEGVTIEKIERLERKEFAYPHNHLRSAYYVNFVASAEPTTITKLRQKLTLMEEVTLQNYFRKDNVKVAGKAKKTANAGKKVAAAA